MRVPSPANPIRTLGWATSTLDPVTASRVATGVPVEALVTSTSIACL